MHGVREHSASNIGVTSERKHNVERVIFNFEDNDDDDVVRANVEGQAIIIDKRNDELIINSKCKQIMRNLCSAKERRRGPFNSEVAEVTQPSFLSSADRILFFKTKTFYLLQERHCFLQKAAINASQVVAAQPYAAFLSPFGETAVELADQLDTGARRWRHRSSELSMTMPPQDGTSAAVRTKKAMLKVHKEYQDLQKTGMPKFMENIRKAGQSELHMLEEKILKTTEGAGYAVLLCDGAKEVKRAEVILNLFPDYNLLLQDGKDEESKLNNLVNHVRTRIKFFDKLQLFYENPCHEDHTAHVFTGQNLDVAEVREELSNLKPKQMHLLDEKKIQKLYSIFKDEYGAAKTTLVADGTQPVVLNRKKLDRVKKYVDDCAEFKGSMLVPYNRESNFFFLMFPWFRRIEVQKKQDGSATDTVSP